MLRWAATPSIQPELRHGKVGQPILNPTLLGGNLPALYRNKKLYFLKSVTGDKTRLVAVSVRDGTRVAGDGNGLRQGLSTEGDPVVDAESKVILWADGILFTFSGDGQTWKSKEITSSGPLQLLFGAFCSLYAAEPGKVSRVN